MSRYSAFIERYSDHYHDRVTNLSISIIEQPLPHLEIKMITAVSFDKKTQINIYFQEDTHHLFIIKDDIFAKKTVEISEEDVVKQILSKPFLTPRMTLTHNKLYSVYKDNTNKFVVTKVE